MIITKKQLEDIENAVGYYCEAGVILGPKQGELCLRVSAKQPDGFLRNYESVFTTDDHLKDRWQAKIEEIKHEAKRDFDIFCKS